MSIFAAGGSVVKAAHDFSGSYHREQATLHHSSHLCPSQRYRVKADITQSAEFYRRPQQDSWAANGSEVQLHPVSFPRGRRGKEGKGWDDQTSSTMEGGG